MKQKLKKLVITTMLILVAIFACSCQSEEAASSTEESTTAEFTTEHDQEYLDTREYIWNFLIDKGYEVQTTAGVPNIGKTDADLGEGSEGWYAYLDDNGEWKEFSVVLFNGEVSAIQPVN